MKDFDDIRPYRDDEVRAVLRRIVQDPECVSAIVKFRCGNWPLWLQAGLRPVVRMLLILVAWRVSTVRAFQDIVERYMAHMLKTTTAGLTVSGLENLAPGRACLFVSNHRDIAMDPALVNWVLYHNRMDTVRIAIGDNLLTKPFASDLMRLNKSFLVRRGDMPPKKLFVALKQLSAYIHHSVVEDNAPVWIAQREGRAKDGIDRTEEAILKMFAMSKPKDVSLADFFRSLNVVPVAISYEWDPCDLAKANELFQKAERGSYEKGIHEDVQSIAMGISGYKGRVHVAFGKPLQDEFTDAASIANAIDQQIHALYRLWPSHYLAAEALGLPVKATNVIELEAHRAVFNERLAQCPDESRPYWLAMYANPVSQAPDTAEQVGACA